MQPIVESACLTVTSPYQSGVQSRRTENVDCLYYAIVEYRSPNKGLILGIRLLGGIIGGVLINLSGYAQHVRGF